MRGETISRRKRGGGWRKVWGRERGEGHLIHFGEDGEAVPLDSGKSVLMMDFGGGGGGLWRLHYSPPNHPHTENMS